MSRLRWQPKYKRNIQIGFVATGSVSYTVEPAEMPDGETAWRVCVGADNKVLDTFSQLGDAKQACLEFDLNLT